MNATLPYNKDILYCGVSAVHALFQNLQAWPLFQRLKTIAALVNYKCKSFIELTPDFCQTTNSPHHGITFLLDVTAEHSVIHQR